MSNPDKRGSEVPGSVPRTDASLLREIRSGDQDAAAELVGRYVGQLQRLADRQLGRELQGRTDADDITQSIFRTLFRRVSEGQYAVPAGDTIWQLLVTIALNKIRSLGNHHRAAKRDIRRSTQVTDEVHALAPDDVALHELELTIGELMRDLNDSQRTMIEHRLQGCDVQEIANRTQRSKRTVERTLQGFRQRLNDVLSEIE